MSLEILVQKAKDLVNVERFGESDPFAEVEFQGRKEKTEVVKSNLSPEWNERLKFDLADVPLSPRDSVVLRVFDHEKVGSSRSDPLRLTWRREPLEVMVFCLVYVTVLKLAGRGPTHCG